jgi:hypothetical protein
MREKVLARPVEVPVVREIREETKDDILVRTLCKGDPNLFESVYGRLPNQEKVPHPRNRRALRRTPVAA